MSKHTPGPWVPSPYEGFGPMTTVRQGCPKTGMRIASTFETTTPVHIERNEANARLIAAAPELLEALIDCREALRQAGAVGELSVVDAAIAKARGEA